VNILMISTGTCFEVNPKMMWPQKFVPQDICQTTE
jgi:hypothetical protein